MFRWLSLGILLAAVSTSSFYRYRARVTGEVIPRHRESGLLIAMRLVVAICILPPVLLSIAAPRWMAWSLFVASVWTSWAGFALGLLTIEKPADAVSSDQV